MSKSDKAKQLFVTIPEGWYSILKNPAKDNKHPETGASNTPELLVGKKIVVSGPASFSLYPGQMYNTIQGHRLRTNQYLIARVYDADAANSDTSATVVDVDGNEIKKSERKGGRSDSPPLTTTLLPTLNNTILTLQKLITTNNTTILEINLLLLFLLVILMKIIH